MDVHPLNQISDEFVCEFGKRIYAKRAAGYTEIEGKTYEQILCDIYGVKWRGSNNGLADVLVEKQLRVGFSVKSKQGIPGKDHPRVSTIVGRCSPDTFNGDHIQKKMLPQHTLLERR